MAHPTSDPAHHLNSESYFSSISPTVFFKFIRTERAKLIIAGLLTAAVLLFIIGAILNPINIVTPMIFILGGLAQTLGALGIIAHILSTDNFFTRFDHTGGASFNC